VAIRSAPARRAANRALLALALGAGTAGACSQVFDLSALGPAPAEAADGGLDADASNPDDAGPHACPSGEGPPMISAGSFCIDSTEVTNEQYAKFLAATLVERPELPPACSFKTTLVPQQEWPAAPADRALPVRHVDWCDALSYCLWAKKRLCGRIGGGALHGSEALAPARSEWASACTGGTAQAYPYGATYEAGRCNTQGDAARPASGSCEGGTQGVLDLVGNVAEWLDSCAQDSGTLDPCVIAGGSFESGGAVATCGTSAELNRGARRADHGIRCCHE
jgi:formylglycine-generating enzyme